MFTVKVVDGSTGLPVNGTRVSVGFDGLLRGFSCEDYTNFDGEVHFDNDNGNGTIYVNGQPKYKGKIEGLRLVYI